MPMRYKRWMSRNENSAVSLELWRCFYKGYCAARVVKVPLELWRCPSNNLYTLHHDDLFKDAVSSSGCSALQDGRNGEWWTAINTEATYLICFEFFCAGVYREGLKNTTNVPLEWPRYKPKYWSGALCRKRTRIHAVVPRSEKGRSFIMLSINGRSFIMLSISSQSSCKQKMVDRWTTRCVMLPITAVTSRLPA
jgi:hypothetical protein